MTNTVPVSSIVSMGVTALVGVLIPVALFLYLRLKKRADIVPFFIGLGVMLVFALTIETLLHQVIVLGTSAGKAILNNMWLYGLYGAFMAALFEEVPRYAAMRTVLRRWHGKDINALMYGAGHGGIEAAYILGVGMVGNLVIAVMMNAGMVGLLMKDVPAEYMATAEAQLAGIAAITPQTCLLSIAERLFALPLQLALSVLVWFAAKDKTKRYLLPVAFAVHFSVDFIAVIVSKSGLSLVLVEAVIALLSAAIALLAWRVWKRETRKAEEPISPEP